MAALIYALCALTSLLCALLLLQAYRRSNYRLLLWGGLCFLGFTLNNAILFADRILFPEIDLSTWRLVVALCSLLVLLYGLIWDSE
jgi:hypothetical protein